MTSRLNARTVTAAIAIAICGQSAFAQDSGARRPYRALFGGAAEDPTKHHTLHVSGSVEAAYEENGLYGGDRRASLLLQDGVYSGVSGGLGYSWQGRRVHIDADAGTSGRYYHDADAFIGVGQYASVAVAAQLGPRVRALVGQSISHSPSYFYGLMPGFGPLGAAAMAGGGAFPLGDQSVRVYGTAASATIGMTRRGSLEVLATSRHSRFGEAAGAEGGLSELRAYSVGGRYRHGITRNASLRMGYVYHDGEYVFTGGSSIAVHDIDVGVDYRRGLSLTRRTTFDFGVGSALVNPPLDVSKTRKLQYRVVGDLGLTHEMGRTWRARLAYNRGVGFVEGFAQPVFADAVNLSLNGFLTRRVDFNAIGGMSVGDVGLLSEHTAFRTWNVSTRLRMAVTSLVAVYADYLSYYQDLGAAVVVPTGVPSRVDRHSAHVGLTLWVPLLRR
ncbi:MAG: hypothetical protein ACREUZ_16180 [Burkholderiales bacterium]